MLAKIEINRKNIEKNLLEIKKINDNLICVLKDDAYGMGLKNIVPILVENQCYYYAVAYEEEAFEIKNIFEKQYKNKIHLLNIIILNYIKEENFEKVIENNFEICIFNMEQFRKYNQKLNKNQKLKLQIKFNIGMNRLGFDFEEIEELKKELDNLGKKGVIYEIKGVYSHVSNGENSNITEKEVEKFENILKKLEEYEIKYKYKHIQASPLLFAFKNKYNYDFARIGMALYGMEPLTKKIPLLQTITLKSKVINIRKIKKGEKISYGNKNILNEDKKVAVVAIGYAHGIQMQMENSGFYVLINGEKALVLGEICMDMIMIDVTNINNVKVNDDVILIGKSGEQEITLLDMAKWTGTIQDDILTKFSEKIEREIL